MTRLPELRAHLVAAAAREVQRPAARRVRPPHRRSSVLAAVVIGVLLAGVAAAASGLLPVGTQVPAKQVPGPYEPQRLGPRTVVATGETPVKGRWQMFWSQTDVGDCLGFQLLDQGNAGGSSIGEGCGDSSTFTAASVSPRPDTRPFEAIVFGRVPESASGIEVHAQSGRHFEARIHPGPEGVLGDFYLVALPEPIGKGQVQQLDADGEPRGFPIDVGGTSARAPRSRRPNYVGGRRVAVSRDGTFGLEMSCPQNGRGLDCVGTLSLRSAGALDRRTWPPPRTETFASVRYRLQQGTQRRVTARLEERTRRLLNGRGRIKAALVLPLPGSDRPALAREVTLVINASGRRSP